MFLTADEVAELTGYQKPSAQIRWLEAERFGFVVGGDGVPKVLREVVLSRLGMSTKTKKEPRLRLTGPKRGYSHAAAKEGSAPAGVHV
nr:DUF4224 domain-containing protein [uncultured Pseudomonas sp.]